MNLPILIYLCDILESAKNISGIILGISILVTLATIFAWCLTNDGYTKDGHEAVNKVLQWIVKRSWLFCIVLLANIIIPSKTTMYLMLGAKYLTESTLPSQVNEILKLKLEDTLKQLRKENKGNDK